MSGEGAFPFDPARIAELGALAAEINASPTVQPMRDPVLLDGEGRVLLSVPNHPEAHADFLLSMQAMFQEKKVWCQLHAGMTLQWAPMLEAGGMLLALRGGAPDGDEHRDGVAVFLTPKGLGHFISELQSIAATLAVQS